MLKLLVIKHFVVISRHQQASLLTTSGKCHNLLWSGCQHGAARLWQRCVGNT